MLYESLFIHRNLILPLFFWKSKDLRMYSLLFPSRARSFLFFLLPLSSSREAREHYLLFSHRWKLANEICRWWNYWIFWSRLFFPILTHLPMYRGGFQKSSSYPFMRNIDLCFRTETLCPTTVDNPINLHWLGPTILRHWCN